MVYNKYKRKFNFGIFLDELLISSGQYLLYYIILNLTLEQFGFFKIADNVLLIISLIIQTYLMVIYGKYLKARFFIAFLTPIVYLLLEVGNGWVVLTEMAHIFLIVFTLISVLIQINLEKTKDKFGQLGKIVLFYWFVFFFNLFILIFKYFF